MNSYFVYLIFTLEGIRNTFEFFAILLSVFLCIAAIMTVVWTIISIDDQGADKGVTTVLNGLKQMSKAFKLKMVLTIHIASLVVVTFVPDTKRIAVIYFAPKILNNEHIQGVPPKVLELIEEWIEELRPDKEEGE